MSANIIHNFWTQKRHVSLTILWVIKESVCIRLYAIPLAKTGKTCKYIY